MPSLTPQQESVLLELSGVAEVIRGSLPGTVASDHAHQVWAWLAPRPLQHYATFGEVDRNVQALRDDLLRLTDPDTDIPKPVTLSKAQIANLLRDLDRHYDAAVRLMKS